MEIKKRVTLYARVSMYVRYVCMYVFRLIRFVLIQMQKKKKKKKKKEMINNKKCLKNKHNTYKTNEKQQKKKKKKQKQIQSHINKCHVTS